MNGDNHGSSGRRYWYQQFEQQRAEAARYRAALEEVLEQIGTSDALPPDLTLTAIENIADRALHPEEEEG